MRIRSGVNTIAAWNDGTLSDRNPVPIRAAKGQPVVPRFKAIGPDSAVNETPVRFDVNTQSTQPSGATVLGLFATLPPSPALLAPIVLEVRRVPFLGKDGGGWYEKPVCIPSPAFFFPRFRAVRGRRRSVEAPSYGLVRGDECTSSYRSPTQFAFVCALCTTVSAGPPDESLLWENEEVDFTLRSREIASFR